MLDNYHEQAGILFPREWIQLEFSKNKDSVPNTVAVNEFIRDAVDFLRGIAPEAFLYSVLIYGDERPSQFRFIVPFFRWNDSVLKKITERELGDLEIFTCSMSSYDLRALEQ